MYVFDHGLFHGVQNDVKQYVDVTFNGHGFDYMFQGMYIPKDNYKIFGNMSYLSKLRNIKQEFVTDYFENISYKYKHINPLRYINQRSKKDIIDGINKEINNVFEEGKNYGCKTLYDSWDYMISHNISSHYPYTNVMSMHNNSHTRTVSFGY